MTRQKTVFGEHFKSFFVLVTVKGFTDRIADVFWHRADDSIVNAKRRSFNVFIW
jgi:hypothetical protein